MLWLYRILGTARRFAAHPDGPLPGPYADYNLARALHMTVVAVRRMPVWEYAGWVAYFRVEREVAAEAAKGR